MREGELSPPSQAATLRRSIMNMTKHIWCGLLATVAAVTVATAPAFAQKKPNIVMLMTDDTGWNDFGAYTGGGAALGHPTPNIDRIAKEGAVFTNWYGQASCTAGRASFMTGRIPIRTALSIVVAPGDPNAIKKETPTMPSSSRKAATRPTSLANGTWATSPTPMRSSTASTR